MSPERTWKNLNRAVAVLVAAGLLSTVPVASADDDAMAPNQGRISFSAGVDFTSGYYFRGIIQENQGLISQPWMDASISLNDNTSLNFGIWNSFNDNQTGAGRNANGNGGGPDSWYEADLYVGLSYDVSEKCSVGVTYTVYTSPNDAFSNVHEFAFSASHDDSDGLGLQPSITIAIETEGTAMGNDKGTYLELAIEPSMSLGGDMTLSIPVTVGLSLGDYYGGGADTATSHRSDPNFGYLDVGAVLTMPLSSVPADLGSWEMSLGVHWLHLNENTELLNDSGQGDEIILSFGISMGY